MSFEVSFDSSEPGTSADDWAADPRFAELLIAPTSATIDGLLTGVFDSAGEVIVVAAHPDDESLGAGGLIAECARRGITVRVVVVTDGAASHPDSPTRTPSQIARDRAAEVTEAVTELHPTASVIRLGFADGGTAQQRDAIRSELARVLENTPGTAVVVAPFRNDGHRDHRIIGELSASLADEHGYALLEYPIWMWHWGSPADERVPLGALHTLTLEARAMEAKARAIAAHATQIAPLSREPGDERVLEPGFLRHFQRANEVFLVTGGAHHARFERRLDADYFDDLYDRHDDPWRFTSRWYERRKRALTIASLPAERFTNALEIGCSIGILTGELAPRVDHMLAIDLSQAAVDRARERLADSAHVSVSRADVADGLPDGAFDLIVLSEVGYYLERSALDRLLGEIRDRLVRTATGTASAAMAGTGTGTVGVFVACHWRHPVSDYPLSGDEVHDAIERVAGLDRIARHIEDDFVLDVFATDSASVAEREGLA